MEISAKLTFSSYRPKLAKGLQELSQTPQISG